MIQSDDTDINALYKLLGFETPTSVSASATPQGIFEHRSKISVSVSASGAGLNKSTADLFNSDILKPDRLSAHRFLGHDTNSPPPAGLNKSAADLFNSDSASVSGAGAGLNKSAADLFNSGSGATAGSASANSGSGATAANSGSGATVIESDATITTDLDATVTDSVDNSGAPHGEDQELKSIVDALLWSPPSASPGRIPSSRLTMGGEPETRTESMRLDECDAVGDGFVRVGRKGDNDELVPGLLGVGKWRRLKGGVTMDSGCSIDTMPTGHAPGIAMGPVPPERANRRINAANGTRIREHGVKQLKFRTRDGKRQDWKMLVTDVKKALKSVATTCDGRDNGECHVLFTRHGDTIINVGEMKGQYTVGKTGIVKGAGELTPFDRTGNTYGMEAWVYVGTGDSGPERFARPVAVP